LEEVVEEVRAAEALFNGTDPINSWSLFLAQTDPREIQKAADYLRNLFPGSADVEPEQAVAIDTLQRLANFMRAEQ
jgi:hypothetical protein